MRPRLGLRMMMLLVALVAVLFAWLGVVKDHRESDARSELNRLLFHKKHVNTQAPYRRPLSKINEAIARQRAILGETKTNSTT